MHAAFSPDANARHRFLRHTARLWDLTACTDSACPSIVLTGHEGPVIHAAFSPDGKRLVTASWDKTAQLWDLTACTDSPCPSIVLQGHKTGGHPRSPDGKRLVTASDDDTARSGI
jgi:WD40 repeat protein